MKIQPDAPKPERSAMVSTKADLRQMKENSRATVDELQAFLRELKGKSPQEMLGLVAASHLIRSCMFATGLVVVGIALGTVLPYAFGEKEVPAEPKTLAAGANEGPPTPPPGAAPAVEPAPEAVTKSVDDPLSTLGVGEEKTAPPDENPLENKKDDFLKDLE